MYVINAINNNKSPATKSLSKNTFKNFVIIFSYSY
jgi:hypothetical protein